MRGPRDKDGATDLVRKSSRLAGKARKTKAPAAKPVAYITTAVHIPKSTHDLLRRVAFKRALADGGRASASALMVEIVERHRKELEAEANAG